MDFRCNAPRSFRRAFVLATLLVGLAAPFGALQAKLFASNVRDGTAFRDRIKNGQVDAGEKSALTGADGSFKLPNGKGRVYLQGGFDILTGLPNNQLLTTPPVARSVGTLTALWQALLDRKQPGAKIKKMLNVKGNVTLVNYVAKPINQVKPKSKAEVLIKRNAQQQTLVQFLKGLAGKKSLRMTLAGEAAPCEIAATEDPEIAALACALIGLEPAQKKQWTALDLTNPETVKNLFLGAGVTLDDANLTILANAAAALNLQIENGTTAEELAALAQLAAAEARLVAAGRYQDLNNVTQGRTPLLTAVTPDTGADLTDAVTNDPNPVLKGVVGSGAVKVRIYQGEGFVEVNVGSGGVWSYAPGGEAGLEDGAYDYAFSSLDAGGVDGGQPQESPLSPVTRLVIDTLAPAPATVNRLLTGDTSPTVTGTWEPEQSLAVTLNGVTYTDLSFVAAGWSLAIPDANALAVGSYDVTTRVTDLAGNATDSSVTGAVTIQAAPTGLFGTGTSVAVGTRPIALASGDFDNNGVVDLAVANQTGNSVSLLLGAGGGSFQAALTAAVGSAPYALAAGNLNGDGSLDLAVVNSGDDTLSLLLGNGQGGFVAQPQILATGSNPFSVTLLTINGDSYPDIAVANENGASVSVFLSNGDGTYPTAASQTVTGLLHPYAIASADVNGDGSDDLVVGNSSEASVAVILSNGDGGFFGPTAYPTGNGVTGVAVRDLDADGWIDIVTANNAGNNVSVLLNDGAGGFPNHVEYLAGTQARNVAIGDVDGDGKPDLMVTSAASSTVGVLTGVGDGTFLDRVSFPTGQTPWGLALGDLNGDDKADLAVANWGSDSVSVLLNQRTNNLFQAKSEYPVASEPYAIGAADLNGDGSADLATANLGSFTGELQIPGSVSVLVNGGSGSFSGHVDYSTQSNSLLGSIVMGLLDGDANPDIMVSNGGIESSLSLLRGTGNGAFADQLRYPLQSPPTALAAGLLDSDGAPDLVVLDGSGVNVYTSNGQVAVPATPTHSYPVSGLLQGVVLAQIDGVNGLDLAITNIAASEVLVFTGTSTGDGSFNAPVGYGTGTSPMSVAAGDVDKNGATDLVVANFGSNTVSLLLGGDGFAAKRDFPVGFAPRAVTLADLDRDGNLDMLVASEAAATVSVLIGNGQGGFWAPVPYAVGGFAFSLAVADFNGDGKPDIASGNWGTNSVTVRFNGSP